MNFSKRECVAVHVRPTASRVGGEFMRPDGGCRPLRLMRRLYRPARDSDPSRRLGGLDKSTNTIGTTEAPENPKKAMAELPVVSKTNPEMIGPR